MSVFHFYANDIVPGLGANRDYDIKLRCVKNFLLVIPCCGIQYDINISTISITGKIYIVIV